MLGKLIKQDFKATARLFIPIICGFVGMSILNKLSLELGYVNTMDNRMIEMISAVLMTFYVISAISLGIVTQIFVAMHFYKTMTGEQGYLTHTLPVKTRDLINSKLIVSVVWEIITSLLIVLSIGLLLAGHFPMQEFREEVWPYVISEFNRSGISLGLITFELFFFCLLGLVYSALMYYASIAIGHLYQKHRLGASIVAFFVIYFIISIISSLSGSVFGLIGNSYNTTMASFWNLYNRFMLISGVFSVVLCIGFYAVTNYIFSKKLNLE